MLISQSRLKATGHRVGFIGLSYHEAGLKPVRIQHREKNIAKIEKPLSFCDQLEAQVAQNQTHSEQLMQAVLREAFGGGK
ncbi:MAG: hypothetical protein ISR59_00060 [Anaerolineales bacterium]|uniref:Type I restriction modification DNA specificity domain-containing protein n=1 Tax=Candidatus Desulfolinea nitratireducens TaxID=2841698 RepID=A0A8J6NLR6_9CHLR|nr:hypothetical protein [Candidatus Desulfolinea nitratireducens]MBL6959473.1 hypothetical protein [Anaerolineales bacterium]